MKSVLFSNSFFFFSFKFFYTPFLWLDKIVLNQKASLINWVLQFYLYQILFSIIFWVLF